MRLIQFHRLSLARITTSSVGFDVFTGVFARPLGPSFEVPSPQ